ncbi:MAG: sensor histidine kinase [Candidatus Onthomonas sp.]
MSELYLPVGISFDGFPEPILLLKGGVVCYQNPAAEAQLPGLTSGEPAPEVLSSLPENGSALLCWAEAQWQAACWPWQEHILVRLTPCSETEILPNHRIPVLTQKLRGPLASLRSAEELLDDLLTPEQRPDGDRYLARANKAQLRLLRLIRSLELASLAPGEEPYDFHPETLDLKGLLHEAYRQTASLAEAAGCTLLLEEIPGNFYVRCDDELMLTQIYHLVSNAIRAMSPGGGAILLRLERTRQSALVSVEDSGPGLTPLELAQLFDPAQGGDTLRTAGAGLGLGITVCRRIAQLHGGSILFANRKAQGVRATISIPLCQPSGGLELRTGRLADSSNGFPLVLRELSDVLPEQCFLPEDM